MKYLTSVNLEKMDVLQIELGEVDFGEHRKNNRIARLQWLKSVFLARRKNYGEFWRIGVIDLNNWNENFLKIVNFFAYLSFAVLNAA